MDRFPLWIEQGFKAWQRNWTAFLGVAVVYVLLLFLAMILCYVPMFFAFGPLTCGFYAVALIAVRGGTPAMDQMGRGKDVLVPAMTTGLVLLVLVGLPNFLYLLIVVPRYIAAFQSHQGDPGGMAQAMAAASRGFLVKFLQLVGLVWSLWLSTRLMFALPLVADRGVSVGEALAGSWALTRGRFWVFLLFYIVISIIKGIGILLCCVGYFASLPLSACMLLAAYDDLTRDPNAPVDAATAPDEPPMAGIPPAPPA